ncbi:uncharacterized protein LOC121374514 [Gigantopelta aegis]|uniref:uncharacterized protein LOC121374514 n=1 Tax=Gigantopelta aegis TaxID=1735272 RepID=UPI001B88D954|nr:uncharacterized protein LOC121374514 [Gigantopelta aegis]
MNKIYWTDVLRPDIRKCGFNGEDLSLVRKLKPGSVPDGLTLDPVSRLIFYTDTGNDVIALMDMVDYYHKTIINTNIDQPRGIALDRRQRMMYWTDWGEKPKIERATYLGESRTTLVSTGLIWPNGITLDTQGQKMYWCDAKTHRIEVIDFDGRNRKSLAHGESFHPFDIFLFEQVVYATDWTSRSIYRVYLDGRNVTSWSGINFKRLNGIHVFRAGAFQNDTNICTTNKGGCEQICIPTSGERQCTCRDGYTLTTNGLNCTVKCNGSDGISCNKHFDNSHIIYDDGTVQTDSGGECIAMDNCTNCNRGFYPSNGYCDMCMAISNCNLEECTSGSDVTCTRCEGVVKKKAGLRAYIGTPDRRQCKQACSWRDDSTRCYPGQCGGELSANCVCHPGFTGQHCQTITTKPAMHVLVQMANSDEKRFEVDSADNQASFWTNVNNPTSVDYNLSAQYTAQSSGTLPDKPAYIEDFHVGIVQGTFDFKLTKGGVLVVNLHRTCRDLSETNPRSDVSTCDEVLTRSVFPTRALPFQNTDRIHVLFETSNGGYVKVRNKETGVLKTFYYEGQTKQKSFTINIDLNKPYHCSIKSPCGHQIINADDIIKRTDDSRIYINTHGWTDDESGIDTLNIQIIQLRYSAGKLQIASGNTVFQTTVNVSQGLTVGFTLTLKGVYSLLLLARDKAKNERKARRIVLYDPISTITTNKNQPLVITSAVASTNYTWQLDTSAISVEFTDRFINSLQTTNNWLAPVADDSDVDSQYDDHEGEITVAGIPNKQGIVKFKTAYLVNPVGDELTREPEDGLFQDQGLKTVVQLHPRLVDGDLISVWVKAYDVKRNVVSERVQVQVDSSPPVIHKLTLVEDSNKETVLRIQVTDKNSGIDRINWKITDTATDISFDSHVKKVSTLGVSTCSQLTSLSEAKRCYCTPRSVCYSKEYSLKLMNVQEEKPTYVINVTVWNNAHNSVTKQKELSSSIQAPEGGVIKGEENSFTWGSVFERRKEIEFYKYVFGPRCFTMDEVASGFPDIKVTKTKETSVSWTAPSAGDFYLTVVAFDSASQPIQSKCSDVVTVGAGEAEAASDPINIPIVGAAAGGVVVVIVIIIVVVVVVKRRRAKKADSEYEHLNRNQPTANREAIFNIAYGLDDDSRNDPPQRPTCTNEADVDGPYSKLGADGVQLPEGVYDVIDRTLFESSTDCNYPFSSHTEK